MITNDEDERSAVPGTTAHRAHLRSLLDGEDDRIAEIAGAPGLTPEQVTQVNELIDRVYREPSLPPRELIRTLEVLLTDHNFGPEAIYGQLEHWQSVLMRRAALRAFRAGMDAARVQSPENE